MALTRTTHCVYCMDEFKTTKPTSRFCSDKCRMRHRRISKLSCFYCGALEVSISDIHQHSTTDSDEVSLEGVKTVNSCKDCNLSISRMNRVTMSVFEYRLETLIRSYTKKYRLDKGFVEWGDEELKETKGHLAQYLRDKVVEVQQQTHRLYYMYGQLDKIKKGYQLFLDHD